jgi:hypothetical protein
MTGNMSTSTQASVASAEAALDRLDEAVSRLKEGDLHRAHRAGGWTVAQVISHMNLATLVWLGDLTRLRHDPELGFFFREEIGHDAVGYPPPTTDIARRQLAATRRTINTCLPAIEPELLDRTVEIPDLGTRTVLEWAPIITGHLESHVEQAFDIMRDREFVPEGL